MTNKTKKIIINTIIVISLVLILILVVHSIKTIKETQKRQTTESIYEYLTNTYKNTENKSSSPLLGFLNYNFEYINPNLSIQSIVNLNLATNSIMNSTGVDNIYNTVCLCPNCHRYAHSGKMTLYQQYELLNKIRLHISKDNPEYLKKFDEMISPIAENDKYYQTHKEEIDHNFSVLWNGENHKLR